MSMWLLVEERAFLSMQETLNLAQTNSRQVKGFLFNPSKKLERQCDDSKTSPTSASVNCVLEYNVFFLVLLCRSIGEKSDGKWDSSGLGRRRKMCLRMWCHIKVSVSFLSILLFFFGVSLLLPVVILTKHTSCITFNLNIEHYSDKSDGGIKYRQNVIETDRDSQVSGRQSKVSE